ncbi:MAG: fumarylacetoacetate hydrolase family protein [Alphaproteobacteria bacterium]|nr:fumarylacetoacetate hydrolase family protein [Alphaproteobacteria bacterium]
MKLATLADGSRDGRLIVVRRDNAVYTDAADIAPCLQAALDDWDAAEPRLRERFEALQSGAIAGEPVDVAKLLAPLPRAYEWIDGSAYLNHVRLVRKARNAEPPATLETDPLVYQGGSGTFLAPTQSIPLGDPSWGLDFEGEVAVVLGDTPMFTKAEDAGRYVRLVMICNDVSCRGLIPPELAKGFGFFTSKPSTAWAPFACTPDELGGAWQGTRVHLPLLVHHNGERVGWAEAGPEMHFGFGDLVQHICRTRAFTAGTILGSGTVSNEDQQHGISCLAEQRMIEIIEHGEASTPFMKPGDTVRIEMLDSDGHSLFGAIDQKVVAV